jgi:hypothetical protein
MAEILQWAAITILALFVIGCVNFIAWLLAARKRALSIMEDLAEEDHVIHRSARQMDEIYGEMMCKSAATYY